MNDLGGDGYGAVEGKIKADSSLVKHPLQLYNGLGISCTSELLTAAVPQFELKEPVHV